MTNEYLAAGRNKAKDALAWTILYGGTAAAKFAICTLAVSAGLIDKGRAKMFTKMYYKIGPQMKRSAWAAYERSGSIVKMLDNLMGASESD